MTIRLLAPHGPYPANATVTLDAATEAGLLAQKLADTNIISGSPYLPPAPSKVFDQPRFEISGGTPVSLIDSKGLAVAIRGLDAGVTRAVTKHGKLVANFASSQWTEDAATYPGGGLTITQGFTGYDANGVRIGEVSRSGQPEMIQLTVGGTSGSAGITTTNVMNGALGGKFVLLVHAANLPGRGVGGTPTSQLSVNFATSSGNLGSGLSVTFNQNQLRNGWNALKFVMRDFSNDAEVHPNGVSVSKLGSKAWANIVANSVTRIAVSVNNSTATGAVFTLDSIWTDFETMPQVVLGCDAIGSDLTNLALPIFQEYGWIGYVATPRRVWASGQYNVADMNYSTPEMRTMYDAGWDWVNHTVNHLPLGTLSSAAQIHYELVQATAWYKSLGLTRGGEFYASPQSSTSSLAEKVIADDGYVIQRHSVKHNCTVMPWGIDNPNSIGGYDMGNKRFSALRDYYEVIKAYGDTWFPFWHVVTLLGDTGTGEDLTGDSLSLTYSAFKKLCMHIRADELAGRVRVCKGMSGFYYGRG